MNKRIKELIEQSTFDDPGCSGDPRPFFDKEKFAESIVREMLKTCEEHPAWTGRMIGEEIKQHFGVEE